MADPVKKTPEQEEQEAGEADKRDIDASGGDANGDFLGKKWDELTGTADKQKAQEKSKEMMDAAESAYGQTADQNKFVDEQSDIYRDSINSLNDKMNANIKSAVDPYVKSLQDTLGEAETQAKDARKTYSQSVQPAMRSNMEEAMRNAEGAMSLDEAGNANNSLQTGIRDQFNQQAAGQLRSGAASSGVLQALGDQQTQQQQASGPGMMTAGMNQAMLANNRGQADNSLAAGMGRAGDLQNQGISLAQQMNDSYYQAGQDAQTRAAGSVSDYQNADLGYQDLNRAMRGEQDAIGGEMSGTQIGAATGQLGRNTGNIGDNAKLDADSAARQLAAIQQKYGAQIGAKTSAAKAAAGGAGGAIPGIFGAVGKYLGG